MNTLSFDNISNTGSEEFLVDVKQEKSEWIKDPATLNTVQSIVDLRNLYTNYKSTGLWDAYIKYVRSTIIDLATGLNKEQAKNSPCKNPPWKTSGKWNVLVKWRFEHTGEEKSDPEVNKFVWCKKHSRKDTNGFQSGIYMPAPHDQERWKERKTARNTAWKGNQNNWDAAKLKATNSKPAPK